MPATAPCASCHARNSLTGGPTCGRTSGPATTSSPRSSWPAAPGDVIAFDLHAFHTSSGGRDRLAWTIEYLALPSDEAARGKTLRWVDGSLEQAFRGFDRERYPAWRDWLENPSGDRRRAAAIDRLRNTGVLDRPGWDVGW